MSKSNSVGIAVFLKAVTFQAEIPRDAVTESIEEIDATLTERGMSVDKSSRVSAMMTHSVGVSAMMIRGEVAQEDAITEIAYAFIYAYAKEQGLNDAGGIRGLIGCLNGNKLMLNPCLDDESFDEAIEEFRDLADEMLDYEDMMDKTPAKPTIH